jgi:hypothetical protein
MLDLEDHLGRSVLGLVCYLGEVGDHGGQRHELPLHLLTPLALGGDVLLRAQVRPAPPLRRHPFDGDVGPVFSSREGERSSHRRQPAEREDARRRWLPLLVLDRRHRSSERQVRQCRGTPKPLETGHGQRVVPRVWVLEQLLHPGMPFLLLVHVC